MERAGRRRNAQPHAQRAITRQGACPMLRVELSSEHSVAGLPLVKYSAARCECVSLDPNRKAGAASVYKLVGLQA